MFIQVEGGKFHQLATAAPVGDGADVFRLPQETACGRSVKALNYFDSEADARRHCGNRERYLCRQCVTRRA